MSSHRLQVLVPKPLDRLIRKAAQRAQLSTSAWVRRAIERQFADDCPASDPLARLQQIGAPTGDIDRVLAEISAGRG